MKNVDTTPTATDRKINSVGIIGLGKLGTALGRLVLAAGLELYVIEKDDVMRSLVISTVLGGAKQVSQAELAEKADAVIVTVPNHALSGLDLSAVGGLVIDATNPWGDTVDAISTAQLQQQFPNIRIARSLNHASYEEIGADARQPGATTPVPGRRAVAVMSDDSVTNALAEELVSALGFDPVAAPMSLAGRFDPDGDLFGVYLSAPEMRAALAD